MIFAGTDDHATWIVVVRTREDEIHVTSTIVIFLCIYQSILLKQWMSSVVRCSLSSTECCPVSQQGTNIGK